MKKVLNKSKSTFLPLLLLCFGFTILSAFLPFNHLHSNPKKDNERIESKPIFIDESIDLKNSPHNDFTESIEFNNPLHIINSNNASNSNSIDLMGLIMIDCPEETILTVGSTSCTASGELPLPTNIQGLCGGNEFQAETFQGGNLNVMGSLEDGDLSVFAQNFAPGTHLIQYTVNDSCDNVFDCEFEVIVPPVSATVIINQNIVVELNSTSTGGEAMATVYTENIGNGSHNPCSSIKLEIRKEVDLCGIPGNATYNADGHPNDGDPDPNSANYDSDDGQSIKFCCEDLTNTLYDIDGDGNQDMGYMKVWLRVWDDTNLDGTPGNEGDSYVEVWTFVKVEDKLAPAIVCPSDITLKCSDDFLNPDITGWAEGFSQCGSTPVEYTDIITNLNVCNVGFIRKRWNIIGRSDIFCDQTITIEDVDDPVSISFPEDITISNCPNEIIHIEPTWTAGPCDVLGYTIDTDTFLFEDGACLKLINEITVINWCDYKPTDPNWNGEGIWEHIQVINVIDETQPVLEDCEDMGEVCGPLVTLTNVAIDTGSENCPTDWLKWQVFVDLLGDGSIDLEFSSFLPYFDNEFNDTNGNGIPDIYLDPTNSGEEVNIQLPDNLEEFSIHKVTWKVTDGCNNVRSCDYDFQVSDQTPPTPACQDTITVGLAPIDPSKLWAINYISDASDNCSSTEDLRYTFSETPPEDDPSYDPDRRSSNYIITSNDITNGFIELSIYTWDENGNSTFCEIVFIIDPDMILNIEETSGVHNNALHQNRPNPFQLSTSISFNLHRATPVKLSIINTASSKTVEIEIAGKEGLNTYELDHDLLSGQGLYYYTMSTKYYRETKKMVLIH